MEKINTFVAMASERKTEPTGVIVNATDIINIVRYTMETVKELNLDALTDKDVIDTGKAKLLMTDANDFLEDNPNIANDLKNNSNFTGDLAAANEDAGNMIEDVIL